ncbi:MAG: isochorismatase family protein [Candidatus Latescibacterota bacterium]|nr:isochorismatase family protein [Candidatus Latescibacterota bacterium]
MGSSIVFSAWFLSAIRFSRKGLAYRGALLLPIIEPVLTVAADRNSSHAEEGQYIKTSLHLKPRYHRWHVDPGVEWIEANTAPAHLDWRVPVPQVALVLVDVWQAHYLVDTGERAEQIIQNRLLPLIDACRQAGVAVVHAPSPPQAKSSSAWLQAPGWDRKPWPDDPAWPPPDFRSFRGDYAGYAGPEEPRDAEREAHRSALRMHPQVKPDGEEPVVATGEELHLYCKEQGILFLLFAGFNTNACILLRDYGTLDMSRRGYAVLIVRDCTTGMESRQTHAELRQTRGAIEFLEMFGKYSVESTEVISGLQ